MQIRRFFDGVTGTLALGCALACSDEGSSGFEPSTSSETSSTATVTSGSVTSSTTTGVANTVTSSQVSSNSSTAVTAASSSANATSSSSSGGSSGGASSGGAGGTSSSSSGTSSTTSGSGGLGGSGGGVSSGCADAGYLICEDFEATAVGDIPEGWSKHGDEVAVADDETHSGAHSLKLGAIPVWERRIYTDASVLGSAHWGRIFYKVQLPVPDAFVHSTIVALHGIGPTSGAAEFRVVDTVKQAIDTPDVASLHQYLYNVQPEDSGEFGRGGPYDQEFDGQWHCAEYQISAETQSYALYIDGALELSFEDGPGEYQDSDIPDAFDELRVGWINYQESPPGFTAWIDDIAFSGERIGCGE